MAMTTRAQVMRQAWQLAREGAAKFGGRASQYIAAALKEAWRVVKLLALGGQRWQKAGMDRVYINELPRWYGLRCSYYNTGNVSSATLDGEPISNSIARRILGDLQFAKVWFDVSDGQFHGKGFADNADYRTVVARVKAAC